MFVSTWNLDCYIIPSFAASFTSNLNCAVVRNVEWLSGLKLTARSSTCAWARDVTENSSTADGKGKTREKWQILHLHYLSMVNFNNIPGERRMLFIDLSQDSPTPVYTSGEGVFLTRTHIFFNPFTRIQCSICYWLDLTWEVSSAWPTLYITASSGHSRLHAEKHDTHIPLWRHFLSSYSTNHELWRFRRHDHLRKMEAKQNADAEFTNWWPNY